MIEAAVMVLRGRDGEDPVVFTRTPMCRSLCVCDCGGMCVYVRVCVFVCFFFLLHSTSIIVTV